MSHCYRISYRSLHRTLTDVEVNSLQDCIRQQLPLRFPGVMVR